MKIDVFASTKVEYELPKEEAVLLSGKAAGICYMPDDIEVLLNEPEEKTIKRANNTLKMGHHSVFDHVNYNLILSGIPKILAMILNNEGMYTTSEKSARYTKMRSTGKEKELYEKWVEKYQNLILDTYPEMKEKQALKLAQENARYLISIFTPATTMAYTTSLRQLNYIYHFFENYIKKEPDIGFNTKLKPVLEEFNNHIEPLIVDNLNADTKGRTISLFAKRDYQEEFGECYSTNYMGTFAQYAQIQRHRTLRYNLKIEENASFYIPRILSKKTDLIEEWKTDIISLRENYPQGMLIKINERGTVEDFILKTKERLCGCVQLETMIQTKETLDKYIAATEKKNPEVHQYLQNYASGVRCRFKDFSCTSPCMWGPKNALSRLI